MILASVYDDGKKHRFEALAQQVAERVIDTAPGCYVAAASPAPPRTAASTSSPSWTWAPDFDRAKLIVLGQARCEKPRNPTHGKRIARTIARLRRGSLGVYMTFSYFSAQTQREVIEDRATASCWSAAVALSDLLDELKQSLILHGPRRAGAGGAEVVGGRRRPGPRRSARPRSARGARR